MSATATLEPWASEIIGWLAELGMMPPPGTCVFCGCTDDDCSGCIAHTGHPCHWIDDNFRNICSACVERMRAEKPEASA